MLKAFFSIRYMSVFAVAVSLVGALVMFLLGGYHTFKAIRIMFTAEHLEANHVTVFIVESLDNFILAFILIYFAYSMYFLFIEHDTGEARRNAIHMPNWMKVQSLGEMKRTLLQVTIVALSLFWLKVVLVNTSQFQWTDLVLPLSIVAIAIAVRLMKFEH